MKKGLLAGIGLLAVVLVIVLLGFGSYVSAKNTLVQKNEDVDQAYSQVNVVQQRRLDLIPNLVATVKGYVNEETTVLTNIANARAGVLSSPDHAGDHTSNIEANRKLDVALGPFFRLQEQYPNLKGSEQFSRLSDELAGTENRIAVERSRYNRTLKDYNIYVKQFPNSFWANIAGYHARDEYFEGNKENSVAPKVDFGK